ncbi:MAG: Conserved membrane protein, possible 4-hydroxybenzoate octaprenyltransferase [Ignavibacteriae bacterium]|nr:MAG: Conserved membrane protein, possible 4-hydroxybenzoate octaprenyltransferase [Ignavibacteriota bacterium]
MFKELKYIIQSMRLHQWVKNFFIFAALLFSGHLFQIQDLIDTILGFFIFSLITSAVYIFNDIIDIEKDKLHPEKSQRPLPSGKLSIKVAIIASLSLAVVSMLSGYLLNYYFLFFLMGYILLNILYTLILKNVVVLDIMAISAGFVLRIYAGATLINVPVSEWLILCTILIALFLGFSKRRSELVTLDLNANIHRSVLSHYSPHFLDQMISIVTASTVMSYALYTISEETITKFGTKNLIYTVPFVLYGIFRYLYLVHKLDKGGNPTLTLIKDKPIIINLLLWILTVSIIIYVK